MIKYISPIVERDDYCTLLLLLNLAEPDWISVPCNLSILHNAICQFSSYKISNKEVINPSKRFCSKNSLIMNSTCFFFNWILQKPNNKQIGKRKIVKILYTSDIHFLDIIFHK